MAISDLISKIILTDEFSKTFDQFNRELGQAEQKSGSLGQNLTKFGAGLTGVVGVIGATAAAIDGLTGKAVETQQAMFNVGAAAAAANTEFGNSVGTVESWTASVQAASDQFRVFGDQDVANGTARLIDMTKRLGFTEEQMQTLLARTADLSAGKTDLTGGIERVTAAMRGEAESAEFLGLSLSETQVRAYAEAQGLVFKELTENEKAQLRFQLFLEQTAALQGRAAESAKTLAGQEAELNRLRERAMADIGQQLLPLRQGEIELMRLLASSSQESTGIIIQAEAAIVAVLLTIGAGFKTLADSSIASFQIIGAGLQALASGQNPLTAIQQAVQANQVAFAEWGNFITSIPQTFDSAFNQTLQGWQAQQQAIEDVTLATGQATTAQNVFATAGQSAASAVAQAYTDLAAAREKSQAGLNARIEAAEFDHAQRIIRIQQDIARATAEAAAQAATAREAAARKLSEGLAEIDRNLLTESVAAQDKYNQDIARLDAERAANKRKAREEIRKIEADLRQDLNDLRRDTDQDIADINSDLADDLADKTTKAEEEKTRIVQEAGRERVRIEQSIAAQRQAVQDQFAGEFADADPFRRQILEFNRQEQLAQLDQQQAAELAALDEQTRQQLGAVDARVAAEAAILEREAAQKRERVAREAAERAEALQREAEERRAAIQARLAEELAADNQRRAELAASLAAEQAARQAAAEQARAALKQKNEEELAAINQQEADKVARAQEALARENENHADRLAQLRFANQQELAALQDKLAEVEREEVASYLRRLQEARTFAAQQNSILNSGGAPQTTINTPFAGFAQGGVVPGPAGRAVPAMVHGGETVLPQGVSPQQTVNNITVNNYGAPGGYAGASQTGRTVLDALRGR